MTTETSDFHKDQILANKYRVISLLGKGGMGVVYRVEQIFLGKQLALKTIEQSELSDFTLSRFQAEARATFAVNHPNIIAVHDYGVLQGGVPFMAMELLEGETLGAFLQQRVLKIEEALDIFIQVCFGLAHAHDCGVVHRDIKPNNIMLMNKLSWDTEGSVKVLDFGIAKLTQNDGGEIQALTRTGEIFGSPFYMSPEQCSGMGKIDKRSDVYSLGCVMFEALTGTPPFVGDSALNTMMMHQGNQAPTMKEAALGAEFPPQLESIIQKMLAKKPEDRYQNLGQTANDLGAFKREDFDDISIATNQSVAKAKIYSNKVVMKKKSYIALLCSIAGICSVSTGAYMVQHQAPVQDLPIKPIQVVSTQTVSTVDEIPRLAFQDAVHRGDCRFSSTNMITDDSLTPFKIYTGLQYLEIPNSDATDRGLSSLKLSKPIYLDVHECDRVNSVENISKLSTLQILNLSRTSITDASLAKLGKMPQLGKLFLYGCKLSPAKLMDLASSTSMIEIQLPDDKALTDKQFTELQNKMPQCVFTNHPPPPLYEIAKNAPKLEALKERYVAMSKINPLATACGAHLWAIAEELYGTGAKTHPPNQKELLLAKRKEALAIFEKNGNESALATLMAPMADLCADLHLNKEAYSYAKRGAALCLDTIMHDESKLIDNLRMNFRAADRAGYTEQAMPILEEALKLVNKFEIKKDEYVGSLNEEIGWHYRNLNQQAKALPFLENYAKFCQEHKGMYPEDYARSFIERAHCTSDATKRKELYNDGFAKIEELNYPDKVNLREHYCDGCVEMARIFNKEGNRSEATAYLRRGLNAASKITNDKNTRKHFFENLLSEEQKGKDI